MKQKNIKINAILNTIKTIFSIIFPLITYPYVSRVLLPENIGKINVGASFVSYFSLIASLGISTYAIRECSAKRNDRDKLSHTASQIFTINMCTTVIAYILMLVILLVFRKFDSYRTLIIIQSTVMIFSTLGCDWINTAMEDFALITIRTVGFQILSLILMFIFIHEPGDYIKYAAISVYATSGANVVNIFYRRKYCTVKLVTDIDWKRHLKPILLLFVMLLAQTIFNSSDITMLGLMRGDYDAGIYGTAVKVSNLISQVVASMAWVVMPRMAYYFSQENYDKINEMLKKALNVLVSIGLPCAVGCICLSEEIILIIAGEKYIEAASVLSILMVCFIFSLIGGSFLGNMVLLPAKKEGLYMIICCISTLVNLVLNFLLIPVGGVNAAAFTTTISSVLIMILLMLTKDKRIKLDYLISVLKAPVVGCIVVVASCILLKIFVSNFFIRTIFCVVLSGGMYLIVQLIFKNEIVLDIIVAFKKKMIKKD